MKTTAHIIAHTHWDREWYRPFEHHRHDFVVLMNQLLAQFEQDPSFASFHLDGQTILLADYLAVHPEKEETLKKWVQAGKLNIGPWYVLQDAFLTSAEANVRNLLYGMADARRFGEPVLIGYFPDTFGIYGQAPQLLKQAGITAAAFGRGVKPTGFNNTVSDAKAFESPYSELNWSAPDGSSVLGILFANWYSNGNEIPVNENEAKAYWTTKLADAKKYASTSHLLFMNGCDHQPVQRNLPEAIKTAQALFPHIQFIQSDFTSYIERVRTELPPTIQTITGELRNQRTDGWSTLVNTASSRIYLKQLNEKAQMRLEKQVEPLLAIEWLLGHEVDGAYVRYAWKQLMENHPHDSICGCSVDEVHEEMVVRFQKTIQLAERLAEASIDRLAEQVDTTGFGEEAIPIVCFNGSGHASETVVETDIAFEKKYFTGEAFTAMLQQLDEKPFPVFKAFDSAGNPVEATFTQMETAFGYELPDDGFRKPYYARRVNMQAHVKLPAFGYTTIYVLQGKQEANGETIAAADGRSLENEWLKVTIHDDGSYDMICKQTGTHYPNLGVYEDSGDIGNEYMYKEANGTRLTTKGNEATVEIVKNTALEARIAIIHKWELPKSADRSFVDEKRELRWHPNRQAGRSDEQVTCEMVTTLSLQKNSRRLFVDWTIDNQATDHRIRVLYPTSARCQTHLAGSVFEVAERSNTPSKEWENPSFDHHMQGYVAVGNEERGVAIAAFGLHEYEVLPESDYSIAVTLLRAVSEMGDWGDFPTAGAQCQGKQTAQWSVYPMHGDLRKSERLPNIYHAYTQPVVKQVKASRGSLPHTFEAVPIEAENMVITAIKLAEDGKAAAIRAFQPGVGEGMVQSRTGVSLFRSTILEKDLGEIQSEAVRPYQIKTYLVKGVSRP
ncbi:alpha-mannosidase [Shouchella clausii]|uniref:alpha-mannosidase n=1 Tax=Shouchella clausii TaxID=79880 RepID=UPI0028995F13|nr:alpha-mannosidase [Shouchella clausii]